MKKWFLLTALVCLFSSCSNGDDPQPAPVEVEKAPLTILAYLVADNNLDDDLLANIGTMYDGLADMDKEATLLIYWDGKSKIGENDASHLILKYKTDGQGNINGLPALDDLATLDEVLEVGEIAKEYSTQLSTDKAVMTKVLKDMVALSPTSKIGLVAGSHGSSWTGSIFMSRSFGQDGSGTDNTMQIPDMVEAISSIGRKFEFILFDACFMGSMEVAYDFRHVSDYQIASVMEVPAYGFPYDVFMKNLYEGSVEGYKQVCDSYIEFYTERYTTGAQAWATIALVDCKEVEALTGLIKSEITAHKEALADYDTSVLQEYGRDGGHEIAYDLEQFIGDLNDGAVPEAFKAQLDKTILYKGCLEKATPKRYGVDASNFCGLGVYIPKRYYDKWNGCFKTLDWFTASGWDTVDFSWNF